jgi:hypothetical protein
MRRGDLTPGRIAALHDSTRLRMNFAMVIVIGYSTDARPMRRALRHDDIARVRGIRAFLRRTPHDRLHSR